MNKTTDIGEGIGVEWRRITYQGLAKIQEIFERNQTRKTGEVNMSNAGKVWEAEQELIRLLCKVVTFTDDAGEVVRVDLTAEPRANRTATV